MNRRTPMLVVTLAFALIPLIVSAAPAAPSVALDGPTTPILDNFNRPNENPLSFGGKWGCCFSGLSGTLKLVNFEAGALSTGTGDMYWIAEKFGVDQEVFGTVTAKPTVENDPIFLTCRIQQPFWPDDTWDGYELKLLQRAGTDLIAITVVTNDNDTFLVSTSLEYSVGDRFLLRCQGNTLTAFRDQGAGFTQILQATDSTYVLDGWIGLRMRGTTARADDYGGGTIGGPPPPSGPTQQSRGICGGRGLNAIATSRCLSDPVNTLTGAFITQVDDLATPGTGVPSAWSRSYTSEDPTVGRLGPGWTDSYAASLLVQGNGDVIVHGDEGQQVYYTKQGDGSFVGAAGALSTLSSIAGGYELLRTDQVKYTFDTQGRLTSQKDRNAQGLTFAYDGSGRLATITDAASRQVTVSYNASNLVSSVATSDGRSVAYAYTSGRLTSVTDVRGKVWTYTYYAGGRLATMVDPLSHTQVTNVYGADGRVQSQTDAVGKTTSFAWDQATEIATVTDARNNAWKHDYTQSVLAKEIDPLNNETQLGHDADLNETAVTGPTSETTTMTYDAAGNLLTATAPASLGSAQKTFVYNARNDPTSITDARAKVTSYTYDASGNTATITQDGTQVGSYTYDAAGRVLTSTDGNSKTTTYTYDANGNLASSTDPLGNKTTYTYDGAGRVLTRVDPKGNCQGCTPANFTWTYTYNPAGQQLTETDPLGNTTTSVYDDAGRLTSSTDAANHTTSYTYDNANRVLTETAPDPDGAGPLAAPVTTSTYDDVGNKLTETDPRGNTSTFAYDSASRLVSETGADPDAAGPLTAPVTTYAYDANGNLASTVEPRGNVSGANPADFRTSYTYDAAGRQLTETRPDPDGAGPQTAPVTTNTYDQVGNLASVRDANNHTTTNTYDAAGRILTVTAPDLGLTTYAYDPAGNLLTRRDDLNHVTTYAYDDAGRLASETSPDPDGPGPQGPAVTSYSYDENGNRLALTDPNGNATPAGGDGVTTHGYDRANRLTSIDYADSTPDATFAYDAVGNRTSMTDGSGSETRTYDGLDRLTAVTRSTNSFSYAYDIGSNLTSRTYPGGAVTNYAYDALNRLLSAENASLTTSYAYDVASNLTQSVLPSANGHVETRVYDSTGRLIEVKNERTSPVQLRSRFLITLDPVGNPTRIDRTGSLVQTQTYTYDASDRIASVCFAASCTAGSPDLVSWTYDKVGNRLTETRSSGTTTSSYDARDHLLQAGATSYTYDTNGNELTAGSSTFTYDLANRLKTAIQGATTTTYSYDGEGKRLQASTGSLNSQKTNFLWDVSHGLPQLAQERNGANTLQREYIYGLKRIRQSQGEGTYYLYDGLGSVANTLFPLGALQKTFSYEPYGLIRTETGSSPPNFFHFTGEYRDPTGLYHLRARQYDPAVGRFLRPDPVAPGRRTPIASSYAYTADRPTVLVDPTGMTFETAERGKLAAWLPTSGEAVPLSLGTVTGSQRSLRPADGGDGGGGGGGGFGGGSRCRVTRVGGAGFFTISGLRFVRGKVLIRDCKAEREPIIDVCVAGKYQDRGDLAFILAYSCAGYVGHPDAWIYSFGTQCKKGALYASAFTYDKTLASSFWRVGRLARAC